MSNDKGNTDIDEITHKHMDTLSSDIMGAVITARKNGLKLEQEILAILTYHVGNLIGGYREALIIGGVPIKAAEATQESMLQDNALTVREVAVAVERPKWSKPSPSMH